MTWYMFGQVLPANIWKSKKHPLWSILSFAANSSAFNWALYNQIPWNPWYASCPVYVLNDMNQGYPSQSRLEHTSVPSTSPHLFAWVDRNLLQALLPGLFSTVRPKSVDVSKSRAGGKLCVTFETEAPNFSMHLCTHHYPARDWAILLGWIPEFGI